jgi:putative resolvase
MLHEGLTTGQAAKCISRHPKTLPAMDRAGVLPARRTASGGVTGCDRTWTATWEEPGGERPRPTVCYCRVSSQAQRPELKNQRRIVEEFAIAKGIANLEFIEEIGGGLNCTRPKFTALVDSVVVDELARLVVAHQDRLARFGFPAVSQAASRHQWT